MQLAGKVFIGILATLLILVCGFVWKENHVGRLDGIGALKLGMREVDVTVAYGRKADCDLIEYPTQKVWAFNAPYSPCNTSVFLEANTDKEIRVTRICSDSSSSEQLSRVYTGRDQI